MSSSFQHSGRCQRVFNSKIRTLLLNTSTLTLLIVVSCYHPKLHAFMHSFSRSIIVFSRPFHTRIICYLSECWRVAKLVRVSLSALLFQFVGWILSSTNMRATMILSLQLIYHCLDVIVVSIATQFGHDCNFERKYTFLMCLQR